MKHIGSISTSIEAATRHKEFVNIARCLALSNGRADEAAQHAASHNAQRILRAGVAGIRKTAVNAGSTTAPGWGEELTNYELLAQSFIAGLKPFSAFDAMLGSFVQLPPHTRATFVTLGATGATPGEASPVMISKLTVDDQLLKERISAAIVVADIELLRFSAGANDLFEQRLRYAVARAVDDAMLDSVINSTSIVSNGSTGNPATDLEVAVKSIATGQNSKVFAVAPPDWVKGAAFARGSGGGALLPNVGISGGDANDVTVIPSDSLAGSDTVAVIDATQCIASSGTLLLDASEEGALQLSDDPTAPGPLTSLWQNNLKALRIRRVWAFELLESSGAALIVNATA